MAHKPGPDDVMCILSLENAGSESKMGKDSILSEEGRTEGHILGVAITIPTF